MMKLRIARSLRARFLLVVVAGVVIPLAIVGLWMARATERSGRALLRARLDGALAQVVSDVGGRWVRIRAGLLDVADDSAVQTSLARSAGTASERPKESLGLGSTARTWLLEDAGRVQIVLRDATRRVRWVGSIDSSARLVPTADAEVGTGGVGMSLPVIVQATGASLGTVEARIPPAGIVPASVAGSGGIGAVLAVADEASGTWLTPLPFDPALLDREEFDWAGERWLVARRRLEEPRLALAAAAPLSGYTAPFESAARRGALALLVVAAATMVLAALLSRRLTHSLERLAVAADAVSRGDLERRVDVVSDDEVGRVARAFNGMVDSLRRTLEELARRERLAGIHEFAASLAHEVRNPLTSIRINLQRVEEQVPAASTLRAPLERALREISRLDRTVSGALRIARSGAGGEDIVDLRVPLERALQVAEPAFEQSGATVDTSLIGAVPLHVRGDAATLEQLFLNLLLNAAQALSPGGRTEISTVVQDSTVDVIIRDNGRGVPSDILDRIFEPFVTSKVDGTGLGLSIARQVALAHGGEVTIESPEGIGTVAHVRLPLLSPSDGGSKSDSDSDVTP
jgi:signal transduction histidine kinase